MIQLNPILLQLRRKIMKRKQENYCKIFQCKRSDNNKGWIESGKTLRHWLPYSSPVNFSPEEGTFYLPGEIKPVLKNIPVNLWEHCHWFCEKTHHKIQGMKKQKGINSLNTGTDLQRIFFAGLSQ